MKISDLLEHRARSLFFWIAIVVTLIQLGRAFVLVGLIIFPDPALSRPPGLGFDLTTISPVFACILFSFSYLSFYSLLRSDFSEKKGSLFAIMYALIGIILGNILYGEFVLMAAFEMLILGIAAPMNALFVLYGVDDPEKYLFLSFVVGMMILAIILYIAAKFSQKYPAVKVRLLQVLLFLCVLGVAGCVRSGDFSF